MRCAEFSFLAIMEYILGVQRLHLSLSPERRSSDALDLTAVVRASTDVCCQNGLISMHVHEDSSPTEIWDHLLQVISKHREIGPLKLAL